MSAPLKMNPREARALADALAGFSKVSRETDVHFGGYGETYISVGPDATIAVRWDHAEREYVIDDRNGS